MGRCLRIGLNLGPAGFGLVAARSVMDMAHSALKFPANGLRSKLKESHGYLLKDRSQMDMGFFIIATILRV
jgi:hypothetical protein